MACIVKPSTNQASYNETQCSSEGKPPGIWMTMTTQSSKPLAQSHTNTHHSLTCHRAGELLQAAVCLQVPAIIESPSDSSAQLLVSWKELKQSQEWWRVEGEGKGRERFAGNPGSCHWAYALPCPEFPGSFANGSLVLSTRRERQSPCHH